MKKLIVLGAFLLTAGMINAQTQTHKANKRQHNQKERIQDGIQSGEITKKEAKQIRRQQKDIQQTKKAAKADGIVTKQEKAVINRKQNQASKNIYRKKHNNKSYN